MSYYEAREEFKGWTSMNYEAGYRFSSCVKSVPMLRDCRENWTRLPLNNAGDAFNHRDWKKVGSIFIRSTVRIFYFSHIY